MPTKIANKTPPQIAAHAFGVSDNRGHPVGYIVQTWECDYVESAEPYGYAREPGHYFCADTQVTRNGNRYGSVNPDGIFTTAAERDAFAAKRLADARKRYVAQYGAR